MLVGGAVIAIGVMSLGCEGPRPALGTMCGHNFVPSLVAVAFAGWIVLGVVVALINGLRENR